MSVESVLWFGDVLPNDWTATRLKYGLQRTVAGGTPATGNDNNWTSQEDGVAWVSIADMTKAPVVITTEKRISFSAMAEKRLEPLPKGTIIYSMYASLGKVAQLGINAVTNQAILGLIPDSSRMGSSYLSYWLQNFERLLGYYASTNTQDNLNAEKVRNIPLLIPPLAEQRSIAAYLDEQTAKIDQLMDMRRQQMALLKEQRTALIQEAVTRGLNPNVPMKDSGLPWLGEIPAHWKTVPLGYLAILLQTGPFGSQLHAHEYIDGGIPVINPSHMADGLIQPDPKCTVDEATAKRLSRHFLQLGDVVFARRGELGRCALVRNEEVNWICGTGSLLMRPEIRTIESQFLVTLFKLKRLKESLILQSVGSTMDNLNTGILSRTGLPLPPLCEQNEILIFIDEQRAKFDTLHDSYTRQLSLLTEYRAALIHECVTGQRSVPEAGRSGY